MARHLITVRRRRQASRRKKQRQAMRSEEERISEVYTPHMHSGLIPVEESKTQANKIDRQERFVQERAERKLQKLDTKWGLGLGPIRARLKWMAQLFIGGG